jgi:hypothetical protein
MLQPTIGKTDYAPANIRYNRLGQKIFRSLALVCGHLGGAIIDKRGQVCYHQAIKPTCCMVFHRELWCHRQGHRDPPSCQLRM